MSDISKIDKNLAVSTTLGKDDIVFYDAGTPPMRVYGVYKDDGKYRRLPEAVAKSVSRHVYFLHANTSGGRVRFVTDSPYVAISVKMDYVYQSSHFPLAGSAGFDLYVSGEYAKTFMPPVNMKDGYESICEFGSSALREITINFPLYSNVCSLAIGLQKGALVKEAAPYANTKPVVYYGSSITQGGCASRPGSCYPSILSRRFNWDYINLGFSGSAKAEDEIIAYIQGLEMSAFVLDYDHNAPTPEHLAQTHEKMFQAVRQTHPDIPIIIMSRPKHILTEDDWARRRIIEKTYENAVKAGDENVYLITGEALTALCGNDGTVDGVHPTDFGFAAIALALSAVMEKITLI